MRKPLNRILEYFNVLMALVYISAGAFLIFSPTDIFSMGKATRIFIGIIIVIYGLYRTYRVIDSIMQKNEK